MKQLYLNIFLLLISTGIVFAQAPNINYQTPKVYIINTLAPPLAPINLGGAVPATVYGQTTTFAGNGSPGSANGVGGNASFQNPYNATFDASGNLFIADCNNQLIRKITTPAALVSTFAGSGFPGYNNGSGTSASFNNPGGVTTDVSGNVYVGDQTNNLIRKITPAGVVTTFAGNTSQGLVNGPSANASFGGPAGLIFDKSGNLYVADRQNNVIRKITPAGVVSTFAGSGNAGFSNGTGTAASFNNPTGMAVDVNDNIYVTDQYNNAIRKITQSGLVTTFAGSGSQGSINGNAASATFNRPFSLSFDVSGNLYLADEFNQLIRQVTPAGLVTTLAGTGNAGSVDGIGSSASFNYPAGVIPDGLGNLYVTETLGQKIRKIIITGYTIDKPLPAGLTFDPTTGIISGKPTILSPATNYTVTAYNISGSSSTIVNITVLGGVPPNISYQTPQNYNVATTISPLVPTNTGGAVPNTWAYGQVSTFAGSGFSGSTNGSGVAATFNAPTRTALDPIGNGYIADRDNNLIRKITPNGVVSTFATGFNQPNGIAVDLAGNVYVTDAASNSIKKITPIGIVTTLTGGSQGASNGFGSFASFYNPFGIAVDATGNIFVADTHNYLIRKITPLGQVTTFAGNGLSGYGNGIATAASFALPGSITLDASGNTYVCDVANQMIRKITPAGLVSTFAGTGVAGSTNGTSATATFNAPSGMALDPLDNYYIADLNNNQIRKIDAAGIVTTLAGNLNPGATDGTGTAATFKRPNDVAFDLSGFLLITDFGNNIIRKVAVTGYSIDKALPAGLVFDGTTGTITGSPTATSLPTIYTITAYNVNGKSATTLTIGVTSLTPQLVTFPPITSVVYGTANFNTAATSNNATIPLTYSSSNTSVATIDANGIIHITGVGQTSITVSQSGNANFSAATPVSQILIVTPATINVIANNQTKIYGSANTTLSVTYTGFVYGETSAVITTLPLISSTATLTSSVGVYPITSSSANAANYIFAYTNGTLTITPASLLITANNQTRIYGIANPALSLTYTGFITGDDASKLTTSASVTTTANLTSPIGTYPITMLAAASFNYIITYIPGILTVITAPRVLIFNPIADKILGDIDFNPGATINTNDPITYTSSDATIAIIINGQIHILKPGRVIITASVASKANYADVSPISQPLVILDDLVRISPVVTPNGDNINDVLRIDGIASYPDNRFTLVNMNGVKVYEIDGYDNVTYVFDGHSNITGAFQPKGTYFYSLQFNVHGQKQRRVGYVVLKY